MFIESVAQPPFVETSDGNEVEAVVGMACASALRELHKTVLDSLTGLRPRDRSSQELASATSLSSSKCSSDWPIAVVIVFIIAC